MAPLPRPRALDLLGEASAFLRPRLARSLTIQERLTAFWAGCVAARDLGPNEAVEAEFLALASETGIAAALGRHAETDLRHVIRMALIGYNPFQ